MFHPVLGVRLGGACLHRRGAGDGFKQRRGGHFNLAVLRNHQLLVFLILHSLCFTCCLCLLPGQVPWWLH